VPAVPLPPPATLSGRVACALRVALAFVTALVTLLPLNLVQLASLPVVPFSTAAFRRINRALADLWWTWCVRWTELLYGTRVVVSGDDVPADDNALLVSNHQTMADIPVILAFADTRERVGDLKWFVKQSIKWVPGIGWGMQFLDCIFLRRDWSRDQASIERTFARVVRGRVPLWLVSFVEGTRIRASAQAANRRFAEERGLRPLEHVLIPRTKGFVATLDGLRGHLDAVYDVTIGYGEGRPTVRDWVAGRAGTVHVHVRRFAITELPADREALAEWLHGRFVVKDGLLDRFYRERSFAGG